MSADEGPLCVDPRNPAPAAPASAAPVRVTVEGRTGIIELNRADKYNCLSLEVFAHIGAALDRPGPALLKVRSRSSDPTGFCNSPVWPWRAA